jgi:surfeit locus 1 family protein
VPIRFKNRRFQPSLFATVLLLIGVGCGVRLGIWQLHRADEKQSLIDQFEHGQAQTVELRNPGTTTLPRYQHVQVTGRYDVDHSVLLDNMPSASGTAGYRVLTPLQLPAGEWLLIDRGWLPMGSTREQLPDVRVTAPTASVRGRLDDLPQPGMRIGENTPQSLGAAWPRVLNFPRQAELEQLLDRQLLPRILLLDADQPNGFERAWGANFGIGPPRHMAYAVQWFAMSVAMFCIYLIVSFKVDADQ